ncbi:MAG: hypothetical protein ABIH46_07455 [Chloroflexota bacterium]
MSRLEELRRELWKMYQERLPVERGRIFIDYTGRIPAATRAASRRAVEEIRRALERVVR